ncbi:exodeoxyribonuclease V subunit beta [Phytohalomonas tamaricis]|uniref:exodeoxyribonuclease V subunit beta n=1 Tax=Phytohalomonas tamaricis TaxID=2081032 RepID=UPI000D0B19A7|nr:exodeoxyribonuclease V subunit beta [Phytohalomonas tamaricis]
MSQPLNIATLPLQGRRLIEASAGTGKTFTLAALYVRLVLGHGTDKAYPRPLMPPEILVVTFTEAATEELRTRIRTRLKEARDVLLGRMAPDKVLAELLADVSDDAYERYASRLDGAARLMDDAAIFTIHGFCQRMLKRHAFDSGSLFAAELVSDVQSLFDAAAEDYWRRMFYPLSASLQAMVAGFWMTPKALGDAVRPLLIGGRAQPLLWGGELIEAPASLDEILEPCEHAQAELERLAAQARAAWHAQSDTIIALLRDAIAGAQLKANVFKPADLEAKLDALQQWADGGGTGLDGALLDSKKQPWCGQARLEGAVKKGGTCPRHDFFAILDELTARQADQPDPRPQILAHCRDALVAALIAEKRRRGVWDFDDLLNGLDDALSGSAGPRLAARIRRELPVAMIDEFQDTDPVQYRIFSTIYPASIDSPAHVAETCALLMIGDPKQAIYAFRGADIHTYLVARRATPSRFTLTRNFRSTHAMVEAVNCLFACANKPFRFEDIPFEYVDAHGRDEQLIADGQSVAALTCWLPDGDDSVRKDDYTKWMSEATCADIQALLTGGSSRQTGFVTADGTLRAVKPADIAVLVRTGREAEMIREVLSRAGIKSVYLSQKTSVFDSREAFHVLQLFEAVAHPRDDRSLRAALATRLLTDSLADVARIEEDELAWEAMVERFSDYHRHWQRFGVLPMLRAVMRDFRIGERLLACADGERRLTDLLHLGELAQSASQRLDGEQALLRWLHRALAGRFEQGLDPESLIQRLESDETLVRVVTIHKSKGLQYPIVYLPFICDYREIDSRATAFKFSHATHGRAVALAPDSEQRKAADEERLAEDLRLLYVALTRAEFACRLGVAPLFKGKLPKDAEAGATTLARSALGALLAETLDNDQALTAKALRHCFSTLVKDGVVAVSPLPRPSQAMILATAVNKTCGARRFTGRIDHSWWIASYTALIEGARQSFDAGQGVALGGVASSELPDTQLGLDIEVLEETTPIPNPPVRTLADFPRGPRAGTFLHGLLEAVDFDRLGSDEFYPEELERLVSSRIGFSNYDNSWKPVLSEWLCNILPTPLHAAVPGLSLARLTTWKTELEFWLPTLNARSTRLDALVHEFEPLPGRRAALAPRRLEGMLKGYIDMVFEAGGRWYVLDWKSNHLGDTPADYTDAAMAEAVVAHRYDLQYVLYTLALHRLLKSRLPDYHFETHVGGVFYIFMRGMTPHGGSGVFYRRPSHELIETLDRWLDGKDERATQTRDEPVSDHA